MSTSGTSHGGPSPSDRSSSREPAEAAVVNRRIAWRTLRLIWRSNPALATGVAATAVVSGLVPAGTVLFTERAVTALTTAVGGGVEDASALVVAPVVGLVVVSLVGYLTGVLEGYLQALLQVRLANEITLGIMQKAVMLEVADFENAATYDALQRANREGGSRPYRLFIDTVSVLVGGVSLVSLATVLMAWNAWLGLAVVLSSIPSLIAEMFFGRVGWQVEHERSARRRWLTYLQFLVTTDRTVREVKSFRLSPLIIGRYRGTLEDFYAMDRSIEGRQSRATGAAGLLSVVVAGGAVLVAARSALATGEVGQFAGYVAAIAAVQSSTGLLFAGIGQLYEHRLFLRELFTFLDAPERSLPDGDARYPLPLRQGVEFRDVTFSYPGGRDAAVRDISFVARPGEIIAFVGPNGAGKSTLTKLINRLYDPSAGQILVDGRPLQEYRLDDVRRRTGVAFQDFVQYEVSARENITYGAVDDVDSDEVAWRAAHKAGADDVVRALPTGMDTRLGKWFDDAQQLSGGQWQRLAIARALAGSPPVVVLDEPTASVDTETEARLFARLREVAAGATCFLVSHRFSTVRRADRIFVLDGGRMVEHGTHGELMAAGGMYARMFSVQAQGYMADAPAEEVAAP